MPGSIFDQDCPMCKSVTHWHVQQIQTRLNYAKLVIFATCTQCDKIMRVNYAYDGTDYKQEADK